MTIGAALVVIVVGVVIAATVSSTIGLIVAAIGVVGLILAAVGCVTLACALAFPDRREELAPDMWAQAPEAAPAVAAAE